MERLDDIFTEQDPIDPDTLRNLGPLRRMAGIWEGLGGHDINPKADGPQHRQYTERMELQPIDPQPNGPQLLYGLRYNIHVNAPDEENTFHSQSGYWLWEPDTGLIMQTLAIPRGQVALAQGRLLDDGRRIAVEARRGATDYGICSTEFLERAFRTDSYRLEITFHDDGSWSYVSDVMLKVHGQEGVFQHRDTNHLRKIGEPDINPWLRRVRATRA